VIKKNQLLGPGYSHEFKLKAGKEEFKVEFEDLLDGTYQIEVPVSEKELDAEITSQDKVIWKVKL
ncbi:unnamed protein product, partial [marine sediment metagenome]